MARSRSAPARKAAPAAKPAPAVKHAPTPAPVQAAPAPAPVAQPQQSGGMMSGLMGTVAEGMAFGTGSAIARHAVGAVVDSFSGSDDTKAQSAAAAAPVAAAQPAAAPTACFNDQKAFMDCLQVNQNDVASCQFYFDQFNMCKNQSSLGFQALP
ncbi:Aste57867_2734 [Aphanomyces stellatus]|uniref:Aste57867_2734 protein n=1 Tax=Aphanomyces stellatus TaxID=120398 RepID=A0A485KCG4_9STRA|nr:hypothetical protein As57867_002727 [Aphanomyces stellatus]VFT79926.1 Aste57867_2734 [Aphanomyces stellatus]